MPFKRPTTGSIAVLILGSRLSTKNSGPLHAHKLRVSSLQEGIQASTRRVSAMRKVDLKESKKQEPKS